MRKATNKGRPGDRRHQAYRPTKPPSTPEPSFLAGADPTGLALGSLLIYLIGRRLPSPECQLGWQLAERWAGQFVQARHAGQLGEVA